MADLFTCLLFCLILIQKIKEIVCCSICKMVRCIFDAGGRLKFKRCRLERKPTSPLQQLQKHHKTPTSPLQQLQKYYQIPHQSITPASSTGPLQQLQNITKHPQVHLNSFSKHYKMPTSPCQQSTAIAFENTTSPL